MVANLVKVISIISIYLLCNFICSIHSGPVLDVNGYSSQTLQITTLSTIPKVPVKDVPTPMPFPGEITINPDPIDPPTTKSNTTDAPPTQSPPTLPPNTSTTVAPAPSPSPTSPTVAPAPVTPPSPTPSPSGGKDRHFDGPSFIGGIVLAAGLSCIGFVGFKVYKARTERNYHTL